MRGVARAAVAAIAVAFACGAAAPPRTPVPRAAASPSPSPMASPTARAVDGALAEGVARREPGEHAGHARLPRRERDDRLERQRRFRDAAPRRVLAAGEQRHGGQRERQSEARDGDADRQRRDPRQRERARSERRRVLEGRTVDADLRPPRRRFESRRSTRRSDTSISNRGSAPRRPTAASWIVAPGSSTSKGT